MKQFILLLALVFLPAMVWAKGVGSDEALRIAEHFFTQMPSSAKTDARRAAKTDVMRVAYTSLRERDEVALYVINRGDDGGFVIVSATDDTDRPILGWSDHGAFDYEKAPIQLKDMLEAYSHAGQQRTANESSSASNLIELVDGRTAFYVNDGAGQVLRYVIPKPQKRAVQRRVESVPNIIVQPLVKVQWDQVGVYAKYVDPYFDSFAGVAAGCVPAAMAQVMKFWEFPARGRGFHMHNILEVPSDIDLDRLALDYAMGRSDELKSVVEQYSHPYNVNYGESVYQWKNMGGTSPTTDEECDNVAKLIFDCHSACSPGKMPNGRGTGSLIGIAAESMVRYFGYSPDMQLIECKGNEDLMRQELDAGRPILVEGDPNPGFKNDGHAFVCDGYAENDYFHFNFGWSGSGDGWYQLTSVQPVTSDFSGRQTAYIGIQPSLVAVEDGQAFINVTPEGMGVVVGGYGDVTVPATVVKDGQSYPVMKVKSRAFYVPTSSYDTFFEQHKREELSRITLPESITEIGSNAFPSHYLTEVNLPSSIRRIGVDAFAYSSDLQKVSIPSIEAWLNIDFESKTLENGFVQYFSNPIWSNDKTHKTRLYFGGEEVTDLVIPASIKEVRPGVFACYQFFNSVTIEEGVEKIGAGAFDRVPLKEINIASTVKEIGAKAFYQHQASTIKISANLARIGSEALSGDMIAEYIVDENNPTYSAYQGILYDKARRTLVHCPNYRPGFREDKYRSAVGIPSSVTTIRAHSFGEVLRKLTLPPSVRNIEDEAFINADNLKDIYVYTQQPLPITTSTFSSSLTSMWNKATVHVPAGAGDAYRAASVWQDMEIVEDQTAGSLPPEHYDYATDYNAIEMIYPGERDGVTVSMYCYVLFDSQPVITYSGSSLLITSNTDRYVFEKDQYLSSWSMMRFAHYDVPTGIEEVKAGERRIVIRTVGDQLVISGLDANTQVMLYGIEGRLLASAKASTNGDISMTIPASNIIVVKAGNQSFKIHTKK